MDNKGLDSVTYVLSAEETHFGMFTIRVNTQNGTIEDCSGYGLCHTYDWNFTQSKLHNICRIYLELIRDLDEIYDECSGDDYEDFLQLLELFQLNIQYLETDKEE